VRKALFALFAANNYTAYPPFSTAKNTKKPYLVVKMNEDLEVTNGRFEQFEVWAYASPGSFVNVDDMVDDIKALLDGKTLICANGRRVYVEYVRTGPDYFDTDLTANTRYVRFRVPTR
jgi:hypothetical protein